MTQAVHQVDALIATVGMPARVHGARAQRVARRRGRGRGDAPSSNGPTARAARSSRRSPSPRASNASSSSASGARWCSSTATTYASRATTHVQQWVDECPDEFPPEDRSTWEPIDVPRAKSEWFDMMLDAHRDFARAIAEDRAAGRRRRSTGTQSVELANAIYLSSRHRRRRSISRCAPGSYGPVFEELVGGP